MKDNISNDSTGKKKMSKRMSLSIVMVVVSLIVLSASAYAWFLITNTPKVKEISLTADTLGDLKIADAKIDEINTGAVIPGSYGDEVDLAEEDMGNLYLSPCTTKDGKSFFKPIYSEGEVTNVIEISSTDAMLHKKYIYEKDFFLKAGTHAANTSTDKNYDIFFVGSSLKSDSGTFVKDKIESVDSKDVISAANAIRISFTFSGGSLKEPVTVIYEPNCERDNKGITEAQGTAQSKPNMANFTLSGNAGYGTKGEKYGTTTFSMGYDTIKQNYKDHSFAPDSGEATRSRSLVTIKEGEDIRVKMIVWLEGTDKDCMDEIAADRIVGQIQFISEENLSQFETTTEESTTEAPTP